MRKKLCLLNSLFSFIFICCFSLTSFAQTPISGKVTSATGEALIGATVVVKGGSEGAATDVDGMYQFRVSSLDAVLLVSYVGYVSQEISLNGKTTINVVLAEDPKQLEQVVVVGYGTQSRAKITGAVSTLSKADLTNRPITQTSQALQGKMAGVTVTQNFGIPGSDNGTIRIRGIGTLGNAEALVLIDGVPGSINDVNPNDIDNLSVLKDAAAASIYGSRAANGVILITTKRGKKNQPLSVTYNGILTAQQATNLPELVDGGTFMELRNEENKNNGTAQPYTPNVIAAYKQNVGTEPNFNTNWFENVLQKSAMQQSHTLSLRGGGERIASSVSLSYLDQDGLTANTNFERLGVRFNNNLQATKKLSFALDGWLRRENSISPNGNGNGVPQLFRMMYEIPNLFPAVWADGTFGEGWNGDNPYAYIHGGGLAESNSSRIQLNLRAKYDLFSWLSAEVGFAPKFLSTISEAKVKTYSYRRIDNSTGVRPTPNSLTNNFSRTNEDFYTGILRFNKSFGKHSLAALVGMESLVSKSANFGASRQNYTLQDYMVLNSGDPNADDNFGSKSEWELFSNFGQIVYTFADKYLLEAKIRRDGSSRFQSENRWGWFPAFSAGWILTGESFLKNNTAINFLKLRASWGQLGNQDLNTGNYPYLSLVSLNQPYFFGSIPVVGAAQTVIANDVITWETASTLNAGVDFSLLKNLLSGSFEVYKKTTEDILFPIAISAAVGLTAAPQNIATVENRGWELVLGWNDKLGKFSYGADFNLSDVRNKVVDLKDRSNLGRNAIIQGEEFQAFYGFEAIGIYRTAEDLANFPTISANVKVGDLIYKDQNGDGKIDATNDKKVIGSNIPRYTFGLTLNAGLAGFDLSVFLQGVGKKNLYFTSFSPGYGGNYSTYQLEHRFAPDDPATHQSATLPRLLPGTNVNTEDNSFYLYDAAYLRVKNVMLSYTLPKNLLGKTKLNQVRIYATGTNLFTLDRMEINTIDPESPTTITGPSFYPNIKAYSLGLDINF